MIRLTVALRHRSDAEVLHYDSRALPSMAEVFHGLGEVETTLAEHAGAIEEGGAELVVRITSRRFEPMVDDSAKRRPKRFTPRPGEF